MRCHHIIEDGVKYLIPGCWGGWYGNCTCYKPMNKKSKQNIEDLEAELLKVRAINDKLNRQNKKLQEENIMLRYRGLPLVLKRQIDNWDLQAETYLYGLLSRIRELKIKLNGH